MSAAVAVHVLYTGRVQGVGFRLTAIRLARGFPVTGWVRNRDDGRVELVAEGLQSEVEGFLQAVRDAFERHIRQEDVNWRPASGSYHSFEVAG